MKLKKIKKYKNNLIKLHIIKLYTKKHHCNVRQLEFGFKKILRIIYKYHIVDKKILFLEFPKTFTKIFKKTKHTLIPESMLYPGLISNSNPILDTSSITEKQMKEIPLNIIKILLRLKNKVNLVVVSNLNSNNAGIIQESFNLRVPVIALNCSRTNLVQDSAVTYKILNSFESKEEKRTHYFEAALLKTVLKRAIRCKRKDSLKKT